MSYLLHNGFIVFFAYLLVMAAGAWSIGRALAATWRPWWQLVPYTILLGLAGRVIFWGLSGGNNAQFYEAFVDVIVDLIVLAAVAAIAYRLTRARKMITQYPWLYEPAGPLSWRERAPSRRD